MQKKSKRKNQRSKRRLGAPRQQQKDENATHVTIEPVPMHQVLTPPTKTTTAQSKDSKDLDSAAVRFPTALAKFILWPFRKVSKLVLVCIVISVMSVTGFFYLRQNHPIRIESSLNQVDDIELTFQHFQSQDISPLCGCFEEQRAEDWRGITFATRHLSISRQGKYPITGFYVTSTMPEGIDWRGNGFRQSADLYSLVIPKKEVFNPQLVLSNQLPESYQVIAKQHFDPQRYFMMFSDKDLNIDLLGDKPLGAWIPSDGSTTNIRYSKGMFPAAKIMGIIDERYALREVPGSLIQDVVGVPLGDFLGPNTVLWSEDNNISILAGKQIIGPYPTFSGGKRITVLVPKPPFSIRVACLPLSQDAVAQYQEYIEDEKDTEEDFLSGMLIRADDSGTVHVSIGDVQGQAQEFTEIYNRLKENDVISVYNIHGDFVEVHSKNDPGVKRSVLPGMQFRYPPIPPNPGFNIFGLFNYIKFDSATGSALLGSHPLDIDIPSTLELHDITALKVKGGVIPIQWSTASDHTKIQLEATAQVFLNGEPISSGFEAFKPYIEYGLAICSMVSAIGAILQVLIARRGVKGPFTI